jgi:translation initiation factor IF-2
VEPVVNSIEKLGHEGEARAKVIHAGVGNVNVTDVNLAVASKAMIVAFNVRTEAEARRIAELNNVSIREYNVIYTMVEELEKLLAGTLEPRYQEVVQGHLEVRATFQAGRRTVAGCYVTDGLVHRRDRVRVLRAGKQIWEGGIESLKRFKDDVNEVRAGFECGILLDGFDNVEVGDTLEVYSNERV